MKRLRKPSRWTPAEGQPGADELLGSPDYWLLMASRYSADGYPKTAATYRQLATMAAAAQAGTRVPREDRAS